MIKASVIGISPDGLSGQCLAAGKYSTVLHALKAARTDRKFSEVWLCTPVKKYKTGAEAAPAKPASVKRKSE